MIPIVDTRSYELVRDRIAEILANELPNQVTLHNASTPGSGNDLNATVFINRITPLSNESMPMINVWMGNGDYDNFTQLKQDGTYIYNVDIYTSSPSTSSGSGDVLSMSKLQKLAGVVQGILMHPSYVTLGFERPFIEHREVRSIATGVPNNNLDAHSVTQARLELVVRVPEHSTTHTPNDIAGYDTQVKIGLTDKGYIYSGDNIPIPEPVCDPVTIEQSDGTLIFSAPSGSTYQVADSVVSNSDNTYIESVKSTENLDLPDIPNVQSDGTTVMTPAQTPFVCTQFSPCYGGVLVQDGLILNLDSSNDDSYSGSGNNWFDLTSNDYDALLFNSPGYITGLNGLLEFDGVNDYGTIDNSFSLDTDNSFTLEMTFNLMTKATTSFVLLSLKTTDSTPYVITHANSGAKLGIRFGSNDGIVLGTVELLDFNVFNHVSITFDGVDKTNSSSYSIQVNGVEKNRNLSNNIRTQANESVIGNDSTMAPNTFFKGYYGKIVLYNKVLSVSERANNLNVANRQFNLRI